MHIGVNNLPKAVTQRCLEQDLNPRPSELTWSVADSLSLIISPRAVMLCTSRMSRQGDEDLSLAYCTSHSPQLVNIISLDFAQFSFRLFSLGSTWCSSIVLLSELPLLFAINTELLRYTHEVTNNCTITLTYKVSLETVNIVHATNYILIAQFIHSSYRQTISVRL